MFENDARPDMADPVGEALRGLGSAVTNEVVTADWTQLRARARARATRRRRRMRIGVPVLSITAAAVIAAALLVIALGSSGGGNRPAITSPTVLSHPRLASHVSTVGGITFVSDNLNQVIAQAPGLMVRTSTIRYPDLDANSDAIAFGAGSAWVLESAKPLGGPAKPIGSPDPSDCGALLQLNTSTMAAAGTLPLKLCPEALAFGDGSLWVLSFQIGVAGYRLTQVDPTSLAVQSTTIIDGGQGGVTPQGDTGAKSLFVTANGTTVTVAVQTATGASQIVTLDAKTLATIESVTIPQARGDATALAANSSATWLGTDAGWVYRIDPSTGTIVGERQLGAWVRSLSATDQAIWMTTALPAGKPASAYPGFDTLELNPTTGAVEHDTGLPLVLAATDGSDLWGIFATPQHGNYIAKIDPSTGTVAGATSAPFKAPAFTPDTIRVNDGTAWIINTNLQTLTKVVPIR